MTKEEIKQRVEVLQRQSNWIYSEVVLDAKNKIEALKESVSRLENEIYNLSKNILDLEDDLEDTDGEE
jgi:predicted  nucleic acid-binding Zn-ribbon protein